MAENPTNLAFDDNNDTIHDLTESGTSDLTPEAAQEIAEEIARNLSEKKIVNIIVAGKTGVGKSTLIGSLLPNQLEYIGAKDGASSDHCILEKYAGEIGDCVVSVYDTRGFCAAETSSRDAKLLGARLQKEFGAESGKTIDLFIFCQEMFERFDDASLTSLTFFGGLIRPSGWNLCLVALTKANLYPPTIEEAKDPAREMIAIRDTMKKKMQNTYFKPRGLFRESENIPFIPVGYRTEKTNKSKLHCCEDSIENLAQECLRRCSPDSALVLASAFSMKKIALAVGVVGTTVAAGGIGALVGGVLTFYVGGAGAIQGALAGGAIGLTGAPAAMGVKATIQRLTERIGLFANEKYAINKKKEE